MRKSIDKVKYIIEGSHPNKDINVLKFERLSNMATEIKRIKIPKYISETIDFIWKNRDKFSDKQGWSEEFIYFDYPDFGRLPAKYNRKLSSGVVDWIQDRLPFKSMTKRQVADGVIGTYLIEK